MFENLCLIAMIVAGVSVVIYFFVNPEATNYKDDHWDDE